VLVTGRGKRATTSKTERTPSGTLEGATVEQEDDVAMTTTQRPSKATTRPKETRATKDGETGPSPPGDRPDQGELQVARAIGMETEEYMEKHQEGSNPPATDGKMNDTPCI